jgi:hypothetical protein
LHPSRPPRIHQDLPGRGCRLPEYATPSQHPFSRLEQPHTNLQPCNSHGRSRVLRQAQYGSLIQLITLSHSQPTRHTPLPSTRPHSDASSATKTLTSFPSSRPPEQHPRRRRINTSFQPIQHGGRRVGTRSSHVADQGRHRRTMTGGAKQGDKASRDPSATSSHIPNDITPPQLDT